MIKELPKEKTPIVESLEKQIILIHGRPKIGKSTFASQFEKPLFLATEPGLKSLETYQVSINNWSDMWDAINLLKGGNHEYLTAVIDTVDNAWMWCEAYIIEQWNMNHDEKEAIIHTSDLMYGKGTHLVRDEFRRAINTLTGTGLGLIMVSHSEDKEFVGTVKTTTTLTGTARRIVEGLADIILYASEKNGERIVYTKPHTNHVAGDRTGKLPETLSLDYNEFVRAFYGNTDNRKKEIIDKILKGESYLREKKIDNFDTEKRMVNSRKKHVGVENLDDADIEKLRLYYNHLKSKAKESNSANAKHN